MTTSVFVDRYRSLRLGFYDWRDSTETVSRVMLAFAFACLTGLAALVRVQTPLSPVPFTGQVLVVLMSGAVLGRNLGAMSQALYVSLGVVGVPWFAGGGSGVEHVVGATGGYLVGFVLAAALVGHVVERDARSKSLAGMLPLMLAGVLVIYAVGATWLAVAAGLTAWEAVVLGVAPFILLDALKAVIAAGAGRLITAPPRSRSGAAD